jgi:hypothetical protein
MESYKGLSLLENRIATLKDSIDTLWLRHAGVEKDLQEKNLALTALLHEKEILVKQIKKSKEILDVDAPKCGMTWSEAEKKNMEASFKDFLYKEAKKRGRSTLAIRYKVLEEISQHISTAEYGMMVNRRK